MIAVSQPPQLVVYTINKYIRIEKNDTACYIGTEYITVWKHLLHKRKP